VLLALVVVIAGLLVVIAMRAGTPDTSAPPPGVQGTSIPQPPVVEMPPIEATAPSSVFSPPAAFAPPASFGPTVDRAAAEAPDVGQGAPRATPPTRPSTDATPNADDARWQNAPADADIDREALRRVLPPLDEIRRTGTNPSRNPPRVSEQYPTRPPEGAGSEVRTTDRRNRPGVARFDGMILKPSAQGDR
jgi:hypothetical protein